MKTGLIIEEHLPLEELNDLIREGQNTAKFTNRLQLIRQVYRTNNIAEACEILSVPLRTGYNWIKKWNKYGPDGLKHKKGAGRPPFLTKEELEELNQWIENEEMLVTHDVYLHIQDKYNIKFSTRQVARIIDKLGYTWVKPYPIADKQPVNAKELLREKTKDIDPDQDIYGLIDETAVQNTPNVGKIIKKKDLNLK